MMTVLLQAVTDNAHDVLVVLGATVGSFAGQWANASRIRRRALIITAHLAERLAQVEQMVTSMGASIRARLDRLEAPHAR